MAQTAMHDRETGLFHRLLTRIEEWGRRNELAHLGAEEMRHLAHDVGLDAGDLSRLAAQDSDAARLLYARLEGLGLTMAGIEAQGVGSARDMERTCGLCADRALCEHDLHERPESGDWRKICPNSWTFDAMERLAAAKS